MKPKLKWRVGSASFATYPLPGMSMEVYWETGGYVVRVGRQMLKAKFADAEVAQIAAEKWLREKVKELAELLGEDE